jgi:hypothetical protein
VKELLNQLVPRGREVFAEVAPAELTILEFSNRLGVGRELGGRIVAILVMGGEVQERLCHRKGRGHLPHAYSLGSPADRTADGAPLGRIS